ncbi:hypothetical protein Avbf_03528 [Armadillidium vulgare]|nr:hypothetical protein Avbf_03528 [Armadillidium vulgare]
MKIDLDDNCAVTLMQDGWSTVGNDPIIAHRIHNRSKSYLVSAVDSGSHAKTAEYCAQAAKDAIKKAKETYNKDVNTLKRVQSQRPDVFSIIDQGYPHPRVRCYRDYNILHIYKHLIPTY